MVLKKGAGEKKLAELQLKEQEDLAQILGEKYKLPYTDLSIVPVHTEALGLVSEEEARAAKLAAFGIHGKKADIAILTPNNQKVYEVVDGLKRKGFTTVLHIASEHSLGIAWTRYKEVAHAKVSEGGMFEVKQENLDAFVKEIGSTADLVKKVGGEMSGDIHKNASKVLELIIAGAVATEASDIHIEPEEDTVRLRLRLDGVLHTIHSFSHEIYHLLLSRIKLLSGLKLNIRHEAQDGRFTIRIGEDDIEIRTSVLPGAYGESIVLRLLNPKTVSLDIKLLGMEDRMLATVEEEIKKPNGMILNTGPTGSGKTTTLYSFLKRVNKPGVKIITIEDPVEYHLEGLTQTQVKKGYTFLQGLRAALRQDPDVIMVGEVRDKETAQIAINASLTGHLVLSTLHTNNAAGAIPRLIDLGVEIKVLGDALTVCMAQRLIRKLCVHCREEYTPNEEEKGVIQKSYDVMPASYKKDLPSVTSITLWRSKGCPKCNNTGYKGREGIFEIILIDEAVQGVILQRPSEHDIWKASAGQEVPRMREHGIIKLVRGITSMDELERVVDIKRDE